MSGMISSGVTGFKLESSDEADAFLSGFRGLVFVEDDASAPVCCHSSFTGALTLLLRGALASKDAVAS